MNKQNLIDRYFSNGLTSEERKLFDELSASDPEFIEMLEFQKDLRAVTEIEDSENFKKELQGFESQHQSKSNSKKFMWMAASLLVLVAVSLFFIFQNPTHETLFANNFEPYRNVIQPIVRGEDAQDLKTKAFAAYEKGEFKTASALFYELNQTEPDSTLDFYQANCQLALDNPEKAIDLLKKYLQNDEVFTDKATWYLALAYIKIGNISEAKPLLNHIISTKSYEYLKAEKLLSELK